MEQPIFYQLTVVMAIAAVVSLLMRLLRQPLIIGYIITGFLVGPALLNVIADHEAFHTFSEIGITLLLFVIGLGLNISVIKSTGKPVLLTFSSFIVILGGLTYASSAFFGFSKEESIVMAIALLLSSTIIVVKALSDKKEQTRLYGRLAIGVLLADDLFATLALLYVSANGADAKASLGLVDLVLKGIGIGAGLAIIGAYLMPKLSKLFASSQELLYIFALAWVFGIASMFSYAGFSIEIGALFAGVSIAHLPYAQAISTRLAPLRDFFIVLFFIQLGEQLSLDNISNALVPAIAFSILAMTIKPLLTMSSLGTLGYTKQTSFKTAIHLSQISEFSIIVVVLAQSNGMISRDLTSIITLTALITIAISTYLIKYDDPLYNRFARILSVFERSETKRELTNLSHYPLVLIGYRQGGYSFVQTFRQMKKRYIVIDFDPDVIENLQHQHINHLYGDATDTELLEEIGLHKSELVISTINDSATNIMLAKHLTKTNENAIFICHATSLDKAGELYDAGASYVLLPHFIGDEHINKFIKRNGSDKKAFSMYRQKHLLSLGSMVAPPPRAHQPRSPFRPPSLPF